MIKCIRVLLVLYGYVFSQVGMHLAGVTDWTTQHVFVDVFKYSRSWLTHDSPWDWNGEWDSMIPVPLDSLGYPNQIPYDNGVDQSQVVHTLMTRENGGFYPAGVYMLIFEGTGSVQVDFDAEYAVFNQAGSYPVNVSPAPYEGIHLTILESDSSDPIRKIRMVMPGYEETYDTEPFFPPFLARLEGFAAIRFKDFQIIDGSHIVSWDQRKTVDYQTQSPGWGIDTNNVDGVAFEYMADITNQLQIDPWFCVPHQADDDFITQMARFLRDNIDPDLKIYIEYSNECWNWMFSQTGYVMEQGMSHGWTNDEYQSGLWYYARRSGEIFHIFEQEFDDLNRIVRVISSQSANPWVGEQVLYGLSDPDINPYGFNADVYGIAPYFGGEIAGFICDEGIIETVTVDEILDWAEADLEIVEDDVITNKALAEQYNVELIAYEGGQHLVSFGDCGENETLNEKLIAANRHYRMKEIYTGYLDTWFEHGGGLMMAYTYVSLPGRYGSWGALEYMDQPYDEAYKYQALAEYGTVSVQNEKIKPLSFTLLPAYPNPFNSVITLRYNLPEDGLINITIYDMMGRQIKTLIKHQQTAGYRFTQWNATNDACQPVSAGLYLYMIHAGEFRQTKKMVLLK